MQQQVVRPTSMSSADWGGLARDAVPRRAPSIGRRVLGLTPRFADKWHDPPRRAAAVAIAYLADHPKVTGVFTCNDQIAIAVMHAAQETDMAVPDRLSIVGYDDIDQAAFVTLQLTTVAVDKVGMGHLAVSLLLHRLERSTGAASETPIRPTLVERAPFCRRPVRPVWRHAHGTSGRCPRARRRQRRIGAGRGDWR
jgi:hypothetical protein